MSYNSNLRSMARMSQISYQTNRPKSVVLLGETLMYEPQKSTNIYSHYENDNLIIVSAHGVNDIKTLTLAIGQFFTSNTELGEVANFCKKYKSLMEETKRVFLIGHSLGAFMILACGKKYGKKFNSFLFAPYIPRTSGAVFNEALSPTYKKIFFDNDFISFNLLRGKAKPSNTLVFVSTFFQVNSHSIALFNQSVGKLNKLIKK